MITKNENRTWLILFSVNFHEFEKKKHKTLSSFISKNISLLSVLFFSTYSFDHLPSYQAPIAKWLQVINRQRNQPVVSMPYYHNFLWVFQIRLIYAHVLFLYVPRNLKLLNKKGTYREGFTAHAELTPCNSFFSWCHI